MLVFRCECDQVLGVESESSKGGLGECPTCGRIIRVPLGLVDASGRLRGNAPLARGSGPQQQLMGKSVLGTGAGKSSTVAVAVAAAPKAPPMPPARPVPPQPVVRQQPSAMVVPFPGDDGEPETLDPLSASTISRLATDDAIGEPTSEAAHATAPTTQNAPVRKSTKSPRAKPPTAAPSTPAALPETQPGESSDPTANMTASQRLRSEAAARAASGQKKTVLLLVVVVVIVAAVVVALWMAGVIGNKPALKSNPPAPAAQPAGSGT